jgi:PadR family transcriptional regulator, regulatory protein PadR
MPSEEGSVDSSLEREPTFPEIEPRPKNWLEPVILVSLREWNSYGYELMERLTQFGFEAMNPGTMYRTLRPMESNGHVKSEWETSKGGTGPPQVLRNRSRRDVPQLLGGGDQAVPANDECLLPAL